MSDSTIFHEVQYNTPMPTPFQHLVYASAILYPPGIVSSSRLPPWLTSSRDIRRLLAEHTGAFMLGNTGVDVQAITKQSRVTTHFYHLPPSRSPRAWQNMLAQYPSLSDPHALAPDHAAFISGYFTHLIYDELWAWEVFVPFYMNSDLWPDRTTRIVHHNALRVILDRQAQDALTRYPGLSSQIRAVEPEDWLPFVDDEALRTWRDWVVRQLDNLEHAETVSVFAERMGVSVRRLEQVARAIATGTYKPAIPELDAAVTRFESQSFQDTCEMLNQYWEVSPASRAASPIRAMGCVP
jgi:hypothetical protein